MAHYEGLSAENVTINDIIGSYSFNGTNQLVFTTPSNELYGYARLTVAPAIQSTYDFEMYYTVQWSPNDGSPWLVTPFWGRRYLGPPETPGTMDFLIGGVVGRIVVPVLNETMETHVLKVGQNITIVVNNTTVYDGDVSVLGFDPTIDLGFQNDSGSIGPSEMFYTLSLFSMDATPAPVPVPVPVFNAVYVEDPDSNTLTVEFTDTTDVTGFTIVSYAWDFGDGTVSTEQNPTHEYSEPGVYDVELSLTDSEDNTYSKTYYCVVLPCEIPGASVEVLDPDVADRPVINEGYPEISVSTLVVFSPTKTIVFGTDKEDLQGAYMIDLFSREDYEDAMDWQ